jgi:hypothetical protein
MSGTLSTWLETALLDLTFAGGTFVPPNALYVALFLTIPGIDGSGGVEPTTGGYARQTVTFSPSSGSPPLTSNQDAIQWATASAPWGTLTGGGVFDDPVFGNFYGAAPLVSALDGVTPAPITIGAGMIMRLPAMGLVLGFSVPPSTRVPFTPPTTLRSRVSMRPIVGEVIDGSGVGRMGLVMEPGP